MHPEEFRIQEAQISGKYLPDKYFNVQRASRRIQALFIPSHTGQSVFVGTDIGIYRSQDSGKSWKQINQGLFNQDIRTISIHPNYSKTIYVGTGRGIFKSEDEGDNWIEWFDETSGLTHPQVNDIFIHPKEPDTIFAATEGGIFKSQDAGDSWEEIYQNNSVLQIEFSAKNPDVIYAVTAKGIIRSKNGGKNWEEVWSDVVTNPISLLALNTDPEFLYSGTQKGLFKSFNGGRNWVTDSKYEGLPVTAGYVNPNNLSQLLFGTGEKIFSSKDGGDSWTPLTTLIHDLNGDSGTSVNHNITQVGVLASKIIFAGTTSGLFISNDEGINWANINLSGAANQLSPDEMKMDVVKIITEIHTGRFFGSYFFMLVDIATMGLIFLSFSGVLIAYYRSWIKKKKPLELETDTAIEIHETTDELASESEEIHDMIEHISEHIEKCRLVYMDEEKKEIVEVSRHLTILDKKMHQMMERLKELDKTSGN